MACPYFTPLEPLPWPLWRNQFRPPLGELYSGRCSALDGEAYEPPEDVLRGSCNMGYARRRCPRIPPGDGPDAVRFAVGELIVGQEYFAEISLEVVALPLDPIMNADVNCAEVFGGDAAQPERSRTWPS